MNNIKFLICGQFVISIFSTLIPFVSYFWHYDTNHFNITKIPNALWWMCFFEHLTLSIQYHKMVLPLLSTRKGFLFLASCLNSIQVGHTFPHCCNWSILPTQTCRSSCREMPWSYTAGQWSRWITYMPVGGCISNGKCH